MSHNVAQWLSRAAREHGARPALIQQTEQGRVSMSYAELDDASARGVAYFRAIGLKLGDAVLVLHPMSIDLYVMLCAIFRAGLVAMFVDPQSGAEQVARCCQLLPPRVFLGSTKAHALRLTQAAIRRIPFPIANGKVLLTRNWQDSRLMEPYRSLAEVAPGAPALVTFTSGSTGQPKCAVRSHAFLTAQQTALVDTLDYRPEDIDMPALPMFVLSNLAAGITSVIAHTDLSHPAAIDPKPVVQQILDEGVTRMTASPAFYERLVQHLEADAVTLPRVTRLFTGGAPVFPALMARIHESFPYARLVAVYGSTEAEPIAHVDFEQIKEMDLEKIAAGHGLLAGEPVAAIQLRVIRNQWGEPLGELSQDDFEAMQRSPGMAGELVVSGDHVLPGYLNGQGDEETKFRVDGVVWHRTGDLGIVDSRGRVWLQGRASALVEDSRGKLYPFAVEAAAQALPGVKRAAVVAWEGKRMMCLEATGTLTEAEREEIRDKLDWAQLDLIRVIDQLPMDKRHNSKIDYPALREMLEKRRRR